MDTNRKAARSSPRTAKSLFQGQGGLFPVSGPWARPEAGLGLCAGVFCRIPPSQNPARAQLPPRNYILMTQAGCLCFGSLFNGVSI